MDKLRQHKSISKLHEDDLDQKERERNLENLLNKANQCPKVCVSLSYIWFTVVIIYLNRGNA